MIADSSRPQMKILRVNRTITQAICFCLAIAWCELAFDKSGWAMDLSASESIGYRNGLISLKGNKLPILPLIEKIAAVTCVRIIVLETSILDRTITVELANKPLDATLKSILKGCNYAVIYPGSCSEAGVEVGLLAGNPVLKRLNIEPSSEFPSPNDPYQQERSETLSEDESHWDKSIGAKLLRKHIEELRRQEDSAEVMPVQEENAEIMQEAD